MGLTFKPISKTGPLDASLWLLQLQLRRYLSKSRAVNMTNTKVCSKHLERATILLWMCCGYDLDINIWNTTLHSTCFVQRKRCEEQTLRGSVKLADYLSSSAVDFKGYFVTVIDYQEAAVRCLMSDGEVKLHRSGAVSISAKRRWQL